MMRTSQYKYIEYMSDRPQLFDMQADSDEENHLAQNPDYTETIRALAEQMRQHFSPEEVEAKVKAFQNGELARLGGVEKLLANWPNKRPYTSAPEPFR